VLRRDSRRFDEQEIVAYQHHPDHAFFQSAMTLHHVHVVGA